MAKVSETKKVAAVIVTYNRKVLLKECVEALLNQEYKNCDVLIIDNNSTDNTKEYISKLLKDKRVKYINTGSNLGGAGGFNYGIREAAQMDYDYIWIMDDDCIVMKDSLTKLMSFAKKKKDDFGFLSSLVLWKDGSVCTMNRQRKTLTKPLNDFDDDCEVAMASFVSLFFKKDTVLEYGLPIKEFFIWTDDWEYTRRISRKEKCYFVADSKVVHKSNSNFGANIAKEDEGRLERYRNLYRNDIYLYSREGIRGFLYSCSRLLLHSARVLLKAKNKKMYRLKIIWGSTFKGFKFNPKIEYVKKPTMKVLEVVGETLEYGGEEAFLINMYQYFDHKYFKTDFFTAYTFTNEILKKLTDENNDKVYFKNYEYSSFFRRSIFKKELNKFLDEHHYDIVHIHSGGIFVLLNGAKIAKKHNTPKVIVHSHNTGSKTLKFYIKNLIIKTVSDLQIQKYVDKFLACSDLAAEFKYPKSIIEQHKYTVIPNGIELKNFYYNEKVRKELRKEWNLENRFVLCNVGRLQYQKNHEFLVQLFNDYYEKDSSAFLILVGSGELEETIMQKIADLGLSNNVLHLKDRDDVNKILQAVDIFLFPSIFEGLGIVAIESQAAGLPTLCSKAVPKDVEVSKLCKRLATDSGTKPWIDEILKIKENYPNRAVKENNEKLNRFDAKKASEMLQKIYKD